MFKNNYVIQYEKRIRALKDKVVIDSAYIGAGFIIVLHKIGYDVDEIEQIMGQVNDLWQEIRDTGKNPMKYCKELTGVEVLVSEHEKQIIDNFFKEENGDE